MKTCVFIVFLLFTFIQHFQQPMDSNSQNNCSLNSQGPYQGINKNPLIGMVSADSSVESVRALFQGAYSAFKLTCIDINSYRHSIVF